MTTHAIQVLLSEKVRLSDLLFKPKDALSVRMTDELLKLLSNLDASIKLLRDS